MPDQPKPKAPDADLQEVSGVEKADLDLGKKIARHRHDPLVQAAGNAGKIGDQVPLYALSAGLLVVGVESRERPLTGSGVRMLAALCAADLSKRLMKHMVSRSRPHVLLDNGRYETKAGASHE